MSHRVCVVGLDGITFRLIDPWVREGLLPTFARLMREGVRARLESVPVCHSAPAWTSLATGTNPGKHGIFNFTKRSRKDLKVQVVQGGERDGVPIWRILSEAGKEVGVVNVPMSYPAEEVKGVMLAGADAPGIDSDLFAYPPGIMDDLLPAIGGYEITGQEEDWLFQRRYDDVFDKQLEVIGQREKCVHYLLRRSSVDFFFVVFTAADFIQHNFWHFMDPGHPWYGGEGASKWGDAILRIYQRLDSVLAGLLEQLGDEYSLVVVSDHGHGPLQRGSWYLRDWLLQQRYLGLNLDPAPGSSLVRGMRNRFLSLANSLLSKDTKQQIKRALPFLGPSPFATFYSDWFRLVDWSTTRAYSEYAWHEVWINLEGREPHGIVKPGEEYDSLCEEIRQALLSWLDIRTGRRVVNRVLRREEVYSGPYVDRAADLQIVWADDVILSPDTFERRVPLSMREVERERKRSGDHRQHGVLILSGKPFKQGVSIDKASIYDVAPTILYVMDQPVLSDMDGKVLEEAFREGFSVEGEIRFIGKGSRGRGKPTGYSERDEARVIERLRDLGYL